MRRFRLLLLLLVLAIVLARISASTAGNAFAPGSTARYTSYAAVTVSRTALGPTLGSLTYNLDSSRTTVSSLTLVLNAATVLNTATVSFNSGPPFACGTAQLVGLTSYRYTCTPNTPQPTKGLASTAVTIR
ncbi:MAG TPA: hypothetical protein VJQ61_10795 [Sinomonas sp.]|nr:hypothetical protein [Sinomonas sp.]